MDGPLRGMRLCVKDNIEVDGQPFGAGHPLFADRRGRRTAPAVRRLLDAGATLAGMTRTDSGGFGMTTPGVGNPWLPGRSVGGSSGGSAAAVVAGLADIGLGTDTGGSIRVPAACTGLFGFKPTYGSVPVEGVWPLAPPFDHVGLLARDLDTIARAAAVLLNDDRPARPASRDAPLRVAVAETAPAFQDRAIAGAFDATLAALERAGHVVTRFEAPDRSALAASFGACVVAAAADVYADVSAADRLLLGPAAQRALAMPLHREGLEASRMAVDRGRRCYEAALSSCDVLLSPTLFIEPPVDGLRAVETDLGRWPILQVFLSGTCFGNITGAPALALPAGGTLSLHLAVRRGADATLFGIAGRLLEAIGLTVF